MSAANTNGVNIAQGDKVSLTGTKSVLVSAAVVKLPSRRRSLSVATEPDDAHGALTDQLNGKDGSFSTDSQASDGSVAVFSVSVLLSAKVSEWKFKGYIGFIHWRSNFAVIITFRSCKAATF